MKRSEINAIIKDAEEFFAKQNFKLPAWASWSLETWKERKEECSEIFDCGLGWDITDFGGGRFHERGLVLFTLRNGRPGSGGKPYAEKIMVVGENQETPFHFHWNKMEDIINRGGGRMAFELYGSDSNEEFTSEPLTVSVDGVMTPVRPGVPLILDPGSSLTLPQHVYHRFYAVEGGGSVLCGEVSMVNDDQNDNRFHESLGRFPEITEDEAPHRLMVPDYRNFL